MNDLTLFACEDICKQGRKICPHEPLEKLGKRVKPAKYFF